MLRFQNTLWVALLFRSIWYYADSGVQAEVFQNLEEYSAAQLRPFDFIIGGGGTAGSVLASRLSENKRFNVLLIEAGPDTAGVLQIDVPGYATQIDRKFNWAFTSVPMPGLGGRSLGVARGHGLGGSTAINGMQYTRGSSEDYDNWARETGDRRWTWNALWPYIKRHERWVPPAGGRNATGEFDPRVHGYNGNVQVSRSGNDLTPHVFRTIENANNQPEFPIVLDGNAGKPIGVTWGQSTIGNGERYTAAKAYLGPSVRKRPNLTILLNTYVTRVRPVARGQGHGSHQRPDLRTVEVVPRAGGNATTITAKKELILSGGAIGSPHILLNSGVGNATDLAALGIPLVLESPRVGQGLIDHVTAGAGWSVAPQSSTTVPPDVALAMWQQNRTGPLTQFGAGHQILWTRIPKDAAIWKTFEDPSPGPSTPHFEMPLAPVQTAGRVVLLQPRSRGSVKLRSSNPLDHPLIDLGFLTHPYDIKALAEGVRSVKRFYEGTVWDGYILSFNGPDPDALPEAEFEAAVRAGATTFAHQVGTVAMGSKHDKLSALDSELKLKGASGLRVVDASIYPSIPAAHTQASVYIMAERAADFISQSW